jgi:hypothetical protein
MDQLADMRLTLLKVYETEGMDSIILLLQEAEER